MSSANVRQVVIDDTDPQILYTGPGWFPDGSGSQDSIGNYGPTYNHTLHGTTMNSSLSFSFKGTHVSVMGTINTKNVSGIYDPTWECFVNNVSIGSNTAHFHKNTWRLCSTGNLIDGSHKLTINITTITGQTFWLDSIRYSPSPGLPLESGAVLLIDNVDPAITYDSGWRKLRDISNMTQTFGSTASFNFTGTSLSWIGFIPADLPRNSSQGMYSIDGGRQTPFSLNGLPDINIDQYNQEFFSTGILPAGQHTLQVTHQGNDSQTPLTLDYFYVTTDPSPANTTPKPQTSTNTIANTNTSTNTNTNTNTNINTSAGTNIGVNTNTSTSTSINTSMPSNVPSLSTHSRPVGAIAGGVGGGTAFIVLILALLFWWRRNSHTRRRDTESFVTPYSYDQGSEHVIAGYHPMLGTSQTKGVVIQPGSTRISFHKSNIPRAL